MRRISLWVSMSLVLLLALTMGSAVLYRLIYSLAALIALSYLGVLLTSGRLEGRVTRLSHYLQVGERVEDRITLRNRGWWPKLLLEVEHHTEPETTGGRVVSLWPRQTSSWTGRGVCQRRGIAPFGELIITVRDPLGLFSRSVRSGQPKQALVYPATVELSGFQVPSGHVWGEGAVRGRTYLHSSVAGGVREYVPGDSFSRIHWPTTARTGELMAKDFEPEPAGPSRDIWLVLDLWAPSQAGTGAESTVEYAVTIAASIAKRYLDLGRTVGLIAGGEERVVAKAAAGQRQLGRIMEELALIKPGPEGPLAATVADAAAQITPKSTVVLITTEGGQALTEAANLLRQKEAMAITITVDAASFRGEPSTGGVSLSTPGSEIESYVVHRGDEIHRVLDAHGREPLRVLTGPGLDGAP